MIEPICRLNVVELRLIGTKIGKLRLIYKLRLIGKLWLIGNIRLIKTSSGSMQWQAPAHLESPAPW